MFGKLVVGLLTAASMAAGVGIMATASSGDAVVTGIVDGDTFDATLDGRLTRIRLLNIDTPETKDPDSGVQCLGPEAAARLAALIPVGSTVDLAYDDERTDRYERTLAAVYAEDGRLVNAELAREGLGTAVVVGNNDRFYDEVLTAQEEARASARGLYAPTVACTIPARAQRVTSAVETAWTQQPPTDPVGLDRAAQQATGLVAAVQALQAEFDGHRRGLAWAALAPTQDRELRDSLATAAYRARSLHDILAGAAAGARERDRLAAEHADRDRAAREQAERDRVVREQAEREAAEREAERRSLAAAPVGPVQAADTDAGTGSPGGGCDPNYTPCVPLSSSDLDCGDLSGGPFTVIGSDPHRLDANDDGVGCESKR